MKEIPYLYPTLGLPFYHKKGQVLFYEDHVPCGLFFIQKGEVHYLKEDNVEMDLEVPDGKILCFSHLLLEQPYCSSCEAVTDVKGIFFPKTSLTPILQNIDFSI